MSKIKIFALGGLNEDGKNMYVVTVDKDIFIFDAGLKYPKDRLLGIDYIIPDYTYLKNNIKKIKGIFLSHGHESNIGAISDIVMDLPDIPIYAMKYTMEILKIQLELDKVVAKNLHVIKPNVKINFGENSIFPIQITHSIPDTTLYVLNTHDGSIVYTGDFIFDPTMTNHFSCDMGRLAYVGKQNVLCLMTESMYAEKPGFTSPKHRVASFIRSVLHDNENRIIMSVLPAHIYRIQEIFDEVSKTNRKIVIMGKMLQDIINMSLAGKYLTINQNKIGDLSNLNDKGVIVLVSDLKDKPYANLERILKDNDKYIKLNETDTIFITEPMYLGIEKRMVMIMDEFARRKINVVALSNKNHLLFHPSQEDLMMMINMMNPKYYFPVKGNYKDQLENANLALKLGINKNNILLKQNGDVITFINGKLQDSLEKVEVDEVLIDGKSQNDVGELVLKDREMLAEAGIVLVSATLDKKTKEILAGPEILTRGFIYVKDNMDILKESSVISERIIKNNISNNYVDYNNIKQEIRLNLGKYFYEETECRPMIITVIGEV
ncbi:MAG: ribonuclease J [Erysipelotrichaceae bacterium]|nr:ribonuclease J [Erysipelotrichaceae bacterium]